MNWNLIVGSDPTVAFISLIFLELIWNACRVILICTSIVYYLEIIKEVRQNTTIRLTDFIDPELEVQAEQEFHKEMLYEYPGHGHRDNIHWYFKSVTFFILTILSDVLAIFACYFRSTHLIWTWMTIYLSEVVVEVVAELVLIKKCTNWQYLKRKWGHSLLTFVLSVFFRLYLTWVGHFLPYANAN